MVEYHFKTHMFTIEIGGYDVVLGAEWIRNLGPVTMDFKELYISFAKEGHKHHIKGITLGSLEINTSYHMDKLLKKL